MILDPLGDYTASESEEGEVGLLLLAPVAGVGYLVNTKYRNAPFEAVFDTVGKEEGVGPDLLRAIAMHESNFNPTVISKPNRNGTRDFGIMQINEATARRFGIEPRRLAAGTPQAVRDSIRIAAKLLKAVRRELGVKANLYTMIAAYNAGSPAIKRRGIFNQGYVASVVLHQQFFILGSLLKSRKGPPGAEDVPRA